ncbi:MAG TPA: DLW-39 family protein [Pseudonocardiaceae bacterium]
MKKILLLLAVAGVVLLIVRRSRASKAEADLWREATAESDI